MEETKNIKMEELKNKMEELKNKMDVILDSYSKKISSIMYKTNWKVESVDILLAGAGTTISLGGDKHKVCDLLWMSKRRHGEESFTTNVRTTGSFELLAGNEIGSEANFYKELGNLIADNALLTSIREQLVSFFNEANVIKEEMKKNITRILR